MKSQSYSAWRYVFAIALLMPVLSGCLSDEIGAEEVAITTTDDSGTGDTAGSMSISGTPSTVAVIGDSYRFRPSVNGGSATIAFNVVNKPTWASFDTSTGVLSGVPDSASVGEYIGIVISATGDAGTVALPAFTISVVDNTIGSVSLSWAAPTANTDGSNLVGLAGYRVYYGRQSGQYSRTDQINNSGVTSATLDNLSAGTWYFSVSAFLDNGSESARSGEISKDVQ
jgi:hypothetical protein